MEMKEKYQSNLDHPHLHSSTSNPLSGLATFPTVDGHYGYNLRIVPTIYSPSSSSPSTFSSSSLINSTSISSYDYSFVESLNKGVQGIDPSIYLSLYLSI